jgi:hypothetical protein
MPPDAPASVPVEPHHPEWVDQIAIYRVAHPNNDPIRSGLG